MKIDLTSYAKQLFAEMLLYDKEYSDYITDTYPSECAKICICLRDKVRNCVIPTRDELIDFIDGNGCKVIKRNSVGTLIELPLLEGE